MSDQNSENHEKPGRLGCREVLRKMTETPPHAKIPHIVEGLRNPVENFGDKSIRKFGGDRFDRV